MKKISFSNIVESVFGFTLKESLKNMIISNLLFGSKKTLTYQKIPDNKFGFKIVMKDPDLGDDLYFLKDGDFRVEDAYVPSKIYPNQQEKRSENFFYDKTKIISLESLSDEDVKYLDDFMKSYIMGQVYKYGKSAD